MGWRRDEGLHRFCIKTVIYFANYASKDNLGFDLELELVYDQPEPRKDLI